MIIRIQVYEPWIAPSICEVVGYSGVSYMPVCSSEPTRFSTPNASITRKGTDSSTWRVSKPVCFRYWRKAPPKPLGAGAAMARWATGEDVVSITAGAGLARFANQGLRALVPARCALNSARVAAISAAAIDSHKARFARM